VFLIGPEQHVRLIDFGLARDTLLSGRSLTIDGTLLGTPAYMSPERISDGAIDGRADLFSLGVILYKMLSGRVPFEGRTPAAVLIAIAKGKPPSLGTVAPGIAPEVADFVMRLIADEPDDRPANADAVAAEIRRLRRTLGA
jgi:serine/threonine protein kinase